MEGGIQEPTVVKDPTGHSSLLVWEVADIGSEKLAAHLLDNNPIREKMSQRLVTRVDLNF